MSSRRWTTCRLCGGALSGAFSLKPTPIADAYLKPEAAGPGPDRAYPLDLMLCRACACLQLADTVDPGLLFAHYTFTTKASLGLVDHFRGQIERAAARRPVARGELVVDIGSNDGSLLRLWQERGQRVLGVDPARELARQATASGVETLPEYFTSALAKRLAAERGRAAVISANNVFAHTDALPDLVDGVRELLADDGVFVFEASYLIDILDKMLWDTVYHEHVCYHAVAPLRSFLARHGLNLFDVERIPTKGGSIRGFAQKAGAPRREEGIVRQLISLERERKLADPATYAAYARRIDEAKRALLAVVDAEVARGRRLAGYGASVTVTTLMHHFELGPRLGFLVDDNPVKQGTLSPGFRLPVLPPSALSERGADAVVVLAWQYAEPIAKRNADYLAKGGRLLVPLPTPRWIESRR